MPNASLPKGSKAGQCRVDCVFCFLLDQTKSRNPGQRHQVMEAYRKAYPHHLKSKQSIPYIYQIKWFKSIWSREFQKDSLVSCKEPEVRVRHYNLWAGWFDQGLCSGLPFQLFQDPVLCWDQVNLDSKVGSWQTHWVHILGHGCLNPGISKAGMIQVPFLSEILWKPVRKRESRKDWSG